jgi:hypothetical protein
MMWWAGAAALAIVVVISVVAAQSDNKASRSGGLIDITQFEFDAGAGAPPGAADWALLLQFDPNTSQLDAADCQAAQPDLNRLEKDTASWPSVLKPSMAAAEKDFQAAIAACTAGDYTTMSNDIGQGENQLQATVQIFGKLCQPTDDLTEYRC